MDTRAARRWAPLVDEHRRSGLTIKAFCEKHNLNHGTFGWWRLRLLRDPVPQQPKTETFIALELAGDPVRPTVVVALESFDAHIVVDRKTDLTLLRDLLAALC
jgi:hypothetical protein